MEVSKYDFLRKVMDLVEQYEQSHQAVSLSDFSLWLTDKVFPTSPALPSGQDEKMLAEGTLESNIARLVSNLYKYTKQYTKNGLTGSPLLTLDEFAFLAYLFFRPAMTKTELIRENLMEIPSGTEIIKRLQKNGLLEDYQDDQDSRAKRVRITPEGRRVMTAVFAQMGKVSQLVAGNLTRPERLQLLTLMHKLDSFHQRLQSHTSAKNWEIDSLLLYLPDLPSDQVQ